MKIALYLVLTISFTFVPACSSEGIPDTEHDSGTHGTTQLDSLLSRCSATLDTLEVMSYQVLHSFTSANTEEAAHNVYRVVFAPDSDDSFGGKIFATNFAGYHVIYDGKHILQGYPEKGYVSAVDTSVSTYSWLKQRFVKNARLGYHHGARIVEKLRSSGNIESIVISDSTWEEERATKLTAILGSKKPVTSGRLEILFRDSDALPVSITETLQLTLDGKKREQFLRSEYINIVLNPIIEEGQFDRRALPESISIQK